MAHESIPRIVYAVGRMQPGNATLLGTAFCVGKGLLATTRHVIGDNDQNLIFMAASITQFSDYQDTTGGQFPFGPATIHAIDPVRDICVLRIAGELSPQYGIGGTDSAPPGTEVVTFGFPHADHGRLVLTQQNSRVGARILMQASGIKSKYLVLNTQARPGQSGSPVFLERQAVAVGMIIGAYVPPGGSMSVGGVDPNTLHQTTHVISAEYITTMI